MPSRAICRTRSMKSCRATRSRPVVGSSRTSARGDVTSARASSTRRASPLDNSSSQRRARWLAPIRSSASAACLPHLVGDHAVAQDAVRGEKAGEHRGLAGDAALAVAGDEPLVQVGRHDAELRSQVEHVPVVAAEHAHRSTGRRRCTSARTSCVSSLTSSDLPGAVGTDDGGVLALLDRQGEASRTARSPLMTVASCSSRTGELMRKFKVESAK